MRGIRVLRAVLATSIGLAAAAVLVPGGALPAAASGPTTYRVTNTSGDAARAGSLPWALRQANYATRGFDYIRFAIPGPGPIVIDIDETLYVNDSVSIDGMSQPGYSGSPRVYVVGDRNVPSVFLLQDDPSHGVSASGATIQGLGMYGYTSNAVTILPGARGTWIQNNWMGFRPSGYGVLRNTTSGLPYASTSRGIAIASSYNVVRNNVISGVDNAVVIGWGSQYGAPYRTNSIRGNRIGTDPSGQTSVGYGNAGDGIFLGPGASENFLGPDNVLSGNGSAGVELFHSTNRGNVVFRNTIGLDANGRDRIGNGELGVLLTGGASYNAIGGPFGGNRIAGNRWGAISIGTSAWGPSSVNFVQDNILGINVDGRAVGNEQVGISVNSGSTRNLIEGNVIGGHAQHGVIVGDTTPRGSTANTVRDNDVGQRAGGTDVANGGFGVFFMNAGYNWATNNRYGANALGPIGQMNSPGLVIS